MSSLVVIPARLASTRLPNKMLLAETGKPLVQHTYDSIQSARKPVSVCVATDSQEIFAAVQGFGGEAIMTSEQCASGTDRVAELAQKFPQYEIFVNVQGDEPTMAGEAVDQVISLLESDRNAVMATLATPIRQRELLDDPACVKVTFDRNGRALYFSRSMIPHARLWSDELLSSEPPTFFLHLGIYAYRRDFLLAMSQLPPSPLEQTEKLEQLRVIQAGFDISVGVTPHTSIGIDTPGDYARFVAEYRREAA